jgi:protein SCO1/2
MRPTAPSPCSRPPRHRRLAGALALAALTLAACTAPSASNDGSSVVDIRGTTLPSPIKLDHFARTAVFDSSAGGRTTLVRLQRGHLMLVYFGYTHCPDVCPSTLADLAQALRDVPAQIAAHTQVVFITSDPQRDTAPVLARFIAHFDGGLPLPFVGLTATLRQIDRIAESVGVPLEAPVVNPDGSVTVQHGAQTLAFVDGAATLLWLSNTGVPDYAHDISLIVPEMSKR